VDQRLTRKERINRKNEIDAVFRKGERLTANGVRFHFLPGNLPYPRLAITVPSRLCGAVGRNRWKRMIREAFRLNKDRIGPGLDLLTMPLRPPEGLRRQDVEEGLRTALERRRQRKGPGP
jgi:ribonuclease P protein component